MSFSSTERGGICRAWERISSVIQGQEVRCLTHKQVGQPREEGEESAEEKHPAQRDGVAFPSSLS